MRRQAHGRLDAAGAADHRRDRRPRGPAGTIDRTTVRLMVDGQQQGHRDHRPRHPRDHRAGDLHGSAVFGQCLADGRAAEHGDGNPQHPGSPHRDTLTGQPVADCSTAASSSAICPRTARPDRVSVSRARRPARFARHRACMAPCTRRRDRRRHADRRGREDDDMMAPQLSNGSTIGIGSLPHRDVETAVEFALDATVIPTIPTLPKRSPAEGMVVQAMLGIEGITVGQYGAISVDVGRIDPLHEVTTDLQHDAFGGFRAFLAAAAGRLEIVKWQMVGPVTLGMALLRAGVPEEHRVRGVGARGAVASAAPARRRRRGAAGVHPGGVHRRARHGRRHRCLVPHRARHGHRSGVGRAGRDRDPSGVGAARVRRRRLGVAHLCRVRRSCRCRCATR